MEIKNNVNIRGYLELYNYTTAELETLTPNEGALAVNSTTDKLVKYDGTNFLPVGGDANIEVVEVTADYNLANYTGDKEVLQIANTSASTVNIIGTPDGERETLSGPLQYKLGPDSHITATLINDEWRLEEAPPAGFEVLGVEGGEGAYTFNYSGDAKMVELVNPNTFDYAIAGQGLDSFNLKAKRSTTLTKLNDVWYPSISTSEPVYITSTINATTSWSDQGGTYRATVNIPSKLSTYQFVSVDVRDSNGKQILIDNTLNGSSSLTLEVNKSPDERFAGTVKIVMMK